MHYTAHEIAYQAMDRETEQSDLAAWETQDKLTAWLETQCPDVKDDNQ